MRIYIPCSRLCIFNADVRLDQSFLTGDNFPLEGAVSCHFWGWGERGEDTSGLCWVEIRDAAQQPTAHSIVPHNREFLAPNGNVTEVGKPWVSMCDGCTSVYFMSHGQFLSSSFSPIDNNWADVRSENFNSVSSFPPLPTPLTSNR